MNALIDHRTGQTYKVRAAIDAMGGDIASLTNIARYDEDTGGSYGWWNAPGYMQQFSSDSHALGNACTGKSSGPVPDSTASFLPFGRQRLQAQFDAFDNSHPGAVTCTADVAVLVIRSNMALKQGNQAIAPDEATAEFPSAPAAATVYGYFYATALRDGTKPAALYKLQAAIEDRCIRLLYGSGSQHAAPALSPAAPAPLHPASHVAGCPTSAELLQAWEAAPPGARRSWITLVPTGFEGTECWHQWIVTSPIVNANGLVVFTDVGGHLSLLPAIDLSEFNAAICGVADAPADWSGPAGPAACS